MTLTFTIVNPDTLQLINLEDQYGAHNYHPLPVVLSRGQGAEVWDVEGKCYLDFLSAYSAVNQGHCHPRIVAALIEQAQKLTLCSRAFYNDQLGVFEKFLCETLGFEKALVMNSGAEANETALKLARKWAYQVKKVPSNEAVIVAVKNNFHGRTLGIISASTDPNSTHEFGPYLPGFELIDYDNLVALEEALSHPNVAAFWFEPIQGEAGVHIPKAGYLKGVRALCDKYNVLMMADEVQTGLGRTGKMLACMHEEVHPDVLILGKALSGGMMPVSVVLASNEVMLTIKPGEHGSTFGGNPLACAVSKVALEVILEEKLCEKSQAMGEKLYQGLIDLMKKYPSILAVRGRGLMTAVDIQPNAKGQSAWDLCLLLMEQGLLAKPTHTHTIRFTPPLILTSAQLDFALIKIAVALDTYNK